VSRLAAPINLRTRTATFNGTWQALTVDHDDTRDLAFDNSGRPLLLATDGGIHKTTDGGSSWTYTGGGRDGYNALQITEVKGQLIEDVGRHDLYFGTQDNDLWSSGDGGKTWSRGSCCEGFFIEMQRRVATSSQSKVTFVACSGCGNYVANPLFTGVVGWKNPPGTSDGNPMVLRQSVHLQGVADTGSFSKGLAITSNLGSNWRQFAVMSEDRKDLPRLARPGTIRNAAIVYQAYRAPGLAPGDFEIDHLARIHKNPITAGNATVYYPAMNNFGGLGINPTMFAWYQVFAVSPVDPYHLIAPDVVNQRVMETRDGGDNWSELVGLTTLATDGGRLRFSSSIFPIVTAISFSPQNPKLVIAGTSEGGVLISTDGGTNWSRIRGTEVVTYVTGFEWISANDVIVSTYGRGLWRLQNQLGIARVHWEDLCRWPPCVIRLPWWRYEGDPAPFEHGILVYEGRVVDARVEANRLREIIVTPGSSLIFVGDERHLNSDVKVSYSLSQSEFGGGLNEFRSPPRGWFVKGFTIDRSNQLAGAVFGDQPMVMAQTLPDEEKISSTKSPTVDKPYIQLSTKRVDGSPSATPGEIFQVSGRNFPRGAALEIAIDGQIMHEKIQVDNEGLFRTSVRAPMETGLHRLKVSVRVGPDEQRVLDGSMFLVKHVDDFKRERRERR
jgi:hypothetical protein